MLRAALIIIITMIVVPVMVSGTSSASQESVVYSCPMHPEVQSSTPGKCPKCSMTLVVQKEDKSKKAAAAASESAEAYTCPMHLEIRTSAPGKCPKCGMTLVASNPDTPEDFTLKMDATPKAPKPNESVKLRFSIYNPRTGQPVKKFALIHDKLFHLFVISQDMSEFQHIHPTFEADGSFTIDTVLPRAGRYKIYSDLYPVDGVPQVLQANLTTAGYTSDLFSGQAQLSPDKTLTRMADGMKIELKIDPVDIASGKPVTLKYHLTDAKTGESVRNLDPYLGALGHTLILSEDQADYVHSHPEELVPESGTGEKPHGGPDVTFAALLPRPGAYRIWTQFLRGETLTTVSFTIKADRLY